MLSNDRIRPRKASITAKKNYRQKYYYRLETVAPRKQKRLYLGKSDSKRLTDTVQSAYKHALISMVNKDIKLLTTLVRQYEEISTENIMDELSPCVRHFSVPKTFIPGLDELREWASAPYDKNPREFPEHVIIASDGTRVRSRAECIIYNALKENCIPFRYDPLLRFRRRNIYGEYEEYYESPDFQIRCPDGSFILIEHAGLLSSSQYTESLAAKIQLYLLNGYILGYTLFVTSDTLDGGIDSHELEMLISYIKSRFPLL